MERIYAALNEGGVMICLGDGVYNEGTKPEEIVTGWPVSGLQGMDYRMQRGLMPTRRRTLDSAVCKRWWVCPPTWAAWILISCASEEYRRLGSQSAICQDAEGGRSAASVLSRWAGFR